MARAEASGAENLNSAEQMNSRSSVIPAHTSGRPAMSECVFYLRVRPLSDAKMVLECRSFTLPQQFTPKYKEPGNHNSGEDLVRTCEFTCDTPAASHGAHHSPCRVRWWRVNNLKDGLLCVCVCVQTCGGASSCCRWCRWVWSRWPL